MQRPGWGVGVLGRLRRLKGQGFGTAVTGPRPPAPLSDETAGKAGIAKDYLTISAPKLKERIKAGAISDLKARGMMYYGFGEPGELKTDQANGTDALVRSLTGAGMGIQEAKDYAQRFAFRPVDTAADMLRKVNTLERSLKALFGEIFRNKKVSTKELEVLGERCAADVARWPTVRKGQVMPKYRTTVDGQTVEFEAANDAAAGRYVDAQVYKGKPTQAAPEAAAPPPGGDQFLEEIGTLLGPDELARIRTQSRTQGREATPETVAALSTRQGILRNFGDEVTAAAAASNLPARVPGFISAPIGAARMAFGDEGATSATSRRPLGSGGTTRG